MKISLKPRHFLSLSLLLLSSGCAYDYASGYAPNYPSGYDAGMGSGEYVQPGDLFGGQDVASIDVFLEPLAQYGRWVNSKYGRAFQPEAGQDYRPYVNGHWGEDRLWISEDPWGWATDHYGRWGFDDDFGWVWVPGTQWAPSWVAWREDGDQDVVGWAPIPPGVSYSIGVGFGSGFYYDDFNSWYAPSWVWVPRNSIYQPGFGGRVLPWNYGRNYWRGSQWNYRSGWNGRPGYNRPGGWAPRAGGQNRDNSQYGRPGYRQPDRRDNNQYGRPDNRRPDGRPQGGAGSYYNRSGGAQPGQRPDGDRFGNRSPNGGVLAVPQQYSRGQTNPTFVPPADAARQAGRQGYFNRQGSGRIGGGPGGMPQVYNGVNPAQPATGQAPAYGGNRGGVGRRPDGANVGNAGNRQPMVQQAPPVYTAPVPSRTETVRPAPSYQPPERSQRQERPEPQFRRDTDNRRDREPR